MCSATKNVGLLLRLTTTMGCSTKTRSGPFWINSSVRNLQWTGQSKQAAVQPAMAVANANPLAIQHVNMEVDRKMLHITWNDGKSGKFPFVWLRDCSPDPSTYTIGPSISVRNLFMQHLDVEVEPVDVQMMTDGNGVILKWPCGTESAYDSDWLRTRNFTDPDTRVRRKQVYLNRARTWDHEEIVQRLQPFKFDDIMNDGRALHDFLCAVCIDGLALISDTPMENPLRAKRKAVDAIGQRIGLIQQTHFGKVFEVSVKPDSSNMAYSSAGELPLHADFPSLNISPELQMLHVVEKADKGGTSLFTDGFKVAEQLKTEQPEVYKLLSTVELEYIERGFDTHSLDGPNGTDRIQQFYYHNVTRHKVINLNDEGLPTNIHYGNGMRSWFYDIEAEQVLPMYRAMKTFVDYCYQPRNLLKIDLNTGDMVLWANSRLLHARTCYESSEGRSRTLEGCYFGWDYLKSRIRVLRDELDLPEKQVSA